MVGLTRFRAAPSRPSCPAACASASAIARTLAAEPRILLMDEPFAALDEQTRLLLGDKVLQIQQELHQTTLLITHSITEAVQLSDRILVMTYRPGRVKRVLHRQPAAPAHVGRRRQPRLRRDRWPRLWTDLREEASRGLADAEHLPESIRSFPGALRSGLDPAAAFVLQALIATDMVSDYVVPYPSDIVLPFWRVPSRRTCSGASCITAGEALPAGCSRCVVGLPLGSLLHRYTAAARRRSSHGSRHSPRRRWCSPIRCSWCCSDATR